ncbi:hypothetical protein IV203_022979 [Nitzschia inconspicua]|uniref:Pre-rRNA-processing protein Ipi1 N-terminal domain-containing protein n=1 Tax=Nitzschia inconspicua TaxID=303405 RepID=A0A9K3KDN2_9STRA|nr:hypothetical protein IV203_022979 [Nitzschia inconspicua]
MPSGGGTKRKKGNTAASASDFKHRKAKVGKRATKALNDTDVSFQAATIHVSAQHQSLQEQQQSTVQSQNGAANTTILISSRGKLLDDLVLTLSHPAAQVRQSSLKGLVDIIQNHPANALLPNLSVLIPSIMHPIVDEDDDVRQLSVDAMAVLLSTLSRQDDGNTMFLSSLLPFATLIMARVSSALHSLDAGTRLTGVQMTKLVAISCPNVIRPHVRKVLAPFVGLLSDDVRTRSSLDSTLQSLVAVLKVSIHNNKSSNNNGRSNNMDDSVDMIYVPGGQSRNAAILLGRPQRSVASLQPLPTVLSQMSDFLGMHQQELHSDDMDVKHDNNKRKGNNNKSATTILPTSILTKLIDCLVECIALNQDVGMVVEVTSKKKQKKKKKMKKLLGTANIDHDADDTPLTTTSLQSSTNSWNISRITLLLHAMPLICQYYQQDYHVSPKNMEFYQTKDKAMKLVMNMFPMTSIITDSSSSNNKGGTSKDTINMAIASMYVDMAANSSMKVMVDKSTAIKNDGWLQSVFDWVTQPAKMEATFQDTSQEWLNLTCKLFQRLRQLDKEGDSKCTMYLDHLMKLLYQLLFEEEGERENEGGDVVVRSEAGRRIYVMIAEIWSSNEKDVCLDISSVKTKFISKAPYCLESWGTDFVYESQHVLQALLSVVRRISHAKGDTIVMLDDLRMTLSCLTESSTSNKNALSIFEGYPMHIQRLFLGLTVMLEQPTDVTLMNLASICSRFYGLEQDLLQHQIMANLIVESIHGIRMSMKMPSYIAFLINTVGMAQKVKLLKAAANAVTEKEEKTEAIDNNIGKIMSSMDASLSQMAHRLLCSGLTPDRVLELLQPQLESWEMSAQSKKDSFYWEYLLKMRCIFVLKGFFYLALHARQCLQDPSMDSMQMQGMMESISHYLHCIASQDNAMVLSSILISPVIGLMVSNPVMVEVMFEKALSWCESMDTSKAFQTNILSILLAFVQDCRWKMVSTNHNSNSNSNSNTNQLLLLDHVQKMVDSTCIDDNEFAKSIGLELAARLQVGTI